MKIKKYRTPIVICVSIVAIVTVVKFSGLGDWIADNTSENCSGGGLCALKLYGKQI